MSAGRNNVAINGEDMTLEIRGPFRWEASTKNRWHLTIDGIHVGNAWRSPSWKRHGHTKPWRPEVFGSSFAFAGMRPNEFRTLDEARRAVERFVCGAVGRIYTAVDSHMSTRSAAAEPEQCSTCNGSRYVVAPNFEQGTFGKRCPSCAAAESEAKPERQPACEACTHALSSHAIDGCNHPGCLCSFAVSP